MSHGPIIWLEGIIGAGKTTVTKTLAEALSLRAIYEPVGSNPYLKLFYEDPRRYAFVMQIELLHRRFALQKIAAYEATAGGEYKGAILDRGLPGDRVFAKLHVLSGNISEMEWGTYERAYNIMTCSLIPPSTLVFLDVEPEVAYQRIQVRGRGVEKNVSLRYLEDLRKGYLDLLIEIESGRHAWSRGVDVMRLGWNTDYQKVDPLIEHLRQKYRLTSEKK